MRLVVINWYTVQDPLDHSNRIELNQDKFEPLPGETQEAYEARAHALVEPTNYDYTVDLFGRYKRAEVDWADNYKE